MLNKTTNRKADDMTNEASSVVVRVGDRVRFRLALVDEIVTYTAPIVRVDRDGDYAVVRIPKRVRALKWAPAGGAALVRYRLSTLPQHSVVLREAR